MYPKMHPPPLSLREFADKEFDYLIVGGGTAGLVIANRLSEVPEFEVGIIEAGPPVFDDPALSRPGLFGLAMGSPHDWKFMSTPQPELRGRRVGFPRGKLLGGTSAMNFMAWTRGNREDYDAWVELGNPGWGWDDMLPFFKKTETFYKPDRIHQRQNYTYYQEEFHGTDGPIKNIHMQEYGPVQQYWHATMNEVGIQTSPDNMSGRNAGAWNMINTIDPTTQSRSWAANAYYLSVAHRANLHLVTEVMTREILLEEDGEGWIAKGVRVRSKGEELTVNAKRETIICAGAVQSPQLLEVSGVGNPSILEPAGIGVKVKSLNVGENLREHLMTETVFEFSPELPSADDFKFDPEQRRLANFAYESSRTGPHTILPCAIAYCPLNKIVSPEHAADIGAKAKQVAKETGKPRETILSRQFDQDKILGQMEYVLDLSNWTSFFQGEPDKKYATIIQILLYPFSYGWIHIPPMQEGKPVTVDDSPVIDPRFFTDTGHIDYDIMTKALHFVDRIASAEPMREIIYRRVCPPARSEDGKDEFEDHVRDTSLTDWHPIGTCAMGGNGGLEVGVVDPRLRVYGVKSLRVADASIFPLPISAHIMATVYAVGEKAAAMIIEDSGVEKPG